ncbi:phytoene synthase [Sphingomonas sp. YR710]|uniref:squalene/phytoene synthase family protein n=1 Tax=Sphingomonas sp. YR710 TaxID=1882773 RepID=UPI000889A16D|nr:squalene/phytoene synthase family protein [Sphingomonas sp. YR710]SDD12642.1 phytoene synthase [Sphingomonas sp. YR710]
MAEALRLADPERQLALAYARGDVRPAIESLWLLDERMGAIVAAAREPMIGQMRLIWWRDALMALDDSDATIPAEPLLARLADLCASHDVSGADLARLEEGWSVLLEGESPDDAAIMTHGRCRGAPLFTMSAAILGATGDGVEAAGEAWALTDLGHRLRSAPGRFLARADAAKRLSGLGIGRWPRALRPLGILAVLARRDAELPVEQQRRQGSPARILRAMAFGVIGR